MTYKSFAVVKVPFPFTDLQSHKTRPALVLSSAQFSEQSGHCLMVMITSARHSAWPLDVPLTDLTQAGLPVACVVRMKLFTLDQRLVIAPIGQLSALDQQAVQRALGALLPR